MRARRIITIAAAALLATAAMGPTTADARNGRIAAGVIGGIAAGALIGAAAGGYWGPGPYYYGYPAPVYYYPPAPYYYAPYGYYGYDGCYRRAVWTGRHWRRVLVCG
ncbi:MULTISPECIES: hypothetical protein [unclassified Bradyrhizobium]|uniref:hypothetical protein n=1 Tax=unclassified Bradyrhizobium TaxID=2631580 RepID=UPI0029168E0C|nr:MULTISPECIES: hypothetical protein [unclassified Bradyrhizobium]